MRRRSVRWPSRRSVVWNAAVGADAGSSDRQDASPIRQQRTSSTPRRLGRLGRTRHGVRTPAKDLHRKGHRAVRMRGCDSHALLLGSAPLRPMPRRRKNDWHCARQDADQTDFEPGTRLIRRMNKREYLRTIDVHLCHLPRSPSLPPFASRSCTSAAAGQADRPAAPLRRHAGHSTPHHHHHHTHTQTHVRASTRASPPFHRASVPLPSSSSTSPSPPPSMSSLDHQLASSLAEDSKNRRSSKRVANAANGKKQKKDSSKKIKKPLCVRRGSGVQERGVVEVRSGHSAACV